ncbi:hypothetical protein MCOR23_000997 [Pyricularia oryzae]|uniref:Uncharacterized protein n=1 Tax=Pyricularia oryzae TaxID=318829 RepID=A0A4P7MZ63_PYROR|nr:hypothetical protein MCOR19_003432 [Pyricularia oryzae]KAI6409311.1 hypothetical protein MCOR23_000997 [Pyricularia oryzae]KAI6621169.1 hypothetical protein MCOR08_008475 [Pyricularia oryzae]QBZ55193.1 hypothetical protein PoMZ_00087 [Pyricularia oryzae]
MQHHQPRQLVEPHRHNLANVQSHLRGLEPPESFLRIVGGMGRRLADTDRDAMITWSLSAISPDYCVRTTRQGNRRSYQLWPPGIIGYSSSRRPPPGYLHTPRRLLDVNVDLQLFSKLMLALTEQSGRESRAMRTLTLAATGHLPANLVMASLCNEPTVSFAWQDQGGVYVRHEVWWAITFMLVLSLLTFAVTAWVMAGINGQKKKTSFVNSEET